MTIEYGSIEHIVHTMAMRVNTYEMFGKFDIYKIYQNI